MIWGGKNKRKTLRTPFTFHTLHALWPMHPYFSKGCPVGILTTLHTYVRYACTHARTIAWPSILNRYTYRTFSDVSLSVPLSRHNCPLRYALESGWSVCIRYMKMGCMWRVIFPLTRLGLNLWIHAAYPEKDTTESNRQTERERSSVKMEMCYGWFSNNTLCASKWTNPGIISRITFN